MRRVVVYGSSGAGKSSLATRLAVADAVHVEIDLLAYDEAGDHVDQSELRDRFTTASSADRWVVEGMHRDQLATAIPSAELFIWLDLPRRTIARRLVTRTVGHVVSGRPRHGRRVTLRSATQRDVPFIIKTLRSVPRRRHHGRTLSDLARKSGVEVVHLTSARAVRRFVASRTGAR